ncbi:thioredoxin domain-containing protein [Niabella beijingensis]|uniref:thioredoxin domain-containing protein n=1 Tax=Niabella beijingensis TaxID=2872700 RepID=UPI001CC0715B|nr:thioredoxin domain-containing protein [Niabella beijingensis]MBZ4188165.1 thioredoxin domain-containing protein [Niabella beijingensis]
MSNHLLYETSPYLLQHAHNPVDWYPWGAEALERAVKEDKPILVSIGYAACHWCHVMERESFEDAVTAKLMNEQFINIKIDREERPDLDHIYMDAVQTMTGSGGWPLNVFLTPAGKPFYGGTYYPPQAYANRPSWKDVLTAVAAAFKEKREEIEKQAEGLTGQLVEANAFGINDTATVSFTQDEADASGSNILKQSDTVWGGFGRAPKFPQTQTIRYLLRYSVLEAARPESLAIKARDQALLSLDKMIEGGIYDQVGGGFARYATDTEWLAPHFEKMLYDNALLVTTLSEAFQVTQDLRYRQCIQETITFIERELLHPQGGFYAALDADSEGEEGKFYVWDKEETDRLLGADAALFAAYYDISETGNWEGKNILRILRSKDTVAAEQGISVQELDAVLERGKARLLEARAARVRPALDDKVLLGWNALMNTAYGKAFEATGDESYKTRAVSNMEFLLEAFARKDGQLLHVWKDGNAKYPAFLDDYAYLIEALLQLYRISADSRWLFKAREIGEKVQRDFVEIATGYFYYTPEGQQDVIFRKKEVYDGATPSGNAVMAKNLLELAVLFDIPGWQLQAERMIAQLSHAIIRYPTSFGGWMLNFYQVHKGLKEIVLSGNYQVPLQALLQQFLPHSVIMATAHADERFPLLSGKEPGDPLWIYLCEHYACQQPVRTTDELFQLINNKKDGAA